MTDWKAVRQGVGLSLGISLALAVAAFVVDLNVTVVAWLALSLLAGSILAGDRGGLKEGACACVIAGLMELCIPVLLASKNPVQALFVLSCLSVPLAAFGALGGFAGSLLSSRERPSAAAGSPEPAWSPLGTLNVLLALRRWLSRKYYRS